MGRAHPYKGFDDLLEALPLVARAGVEVPHLLLAAVTETEPDHLCAYQRHLAAAVARDALDVTLITRHDPALPALLAHPALAGVVVPSRVEPAGRVPFEAYAVGAAPLVATTAGGLAETVVDGVTGYTATPGDPRALAAALTRALRAAPEDLARQRDAGRRLLAGRDYDRTVGRVLAGLVPDLVGSGHGT